MRLALPVINADAQQRGGQQAENPSGERFFQFLVDHAVGRMLLRARTLDAFRRHDVRQIAVEHGFVQIEKAAVAAQKAAHKYRLGHIVVMAVFQGFNLPLAAQLGTQRCRSVGAADG